MFFSSIYNTCVWCIHNENKQIHDNNIHYHRGTRVVVVVAHTKKYISWFMIARTDIYMKIPCVDISDEQQMKYIMMILIKMYPCVSFSVECYTLPTNIFNDPFYELVDTSYFFDAGKIAQQISWWEKYTQSNILFVLFPLLDLHRPSSQFLCFMDMIIRTN